MGDGDDDGLIAALSARGLAARWMMWDDPATLSADLVIPRATWDYTDRVDEFRQWATAVPLRNPGPIVVWNSDKRYLLDVAAAGIAIPATLVLEPGERLTGVSGDVVVKPSVGVGSRDVARHRSLATAHEHIDRLHATGRTVLVQDFVSSVDAEGETALVFIAGERNHAFTKDAMLNADAESAQVHAENLTAAQPSERCWSVAERALEVAAQIHGLTSTQLLYARVDVLDAASDRPLVLEIELIEPTLGWRQASDADRERGQRRFALAVEAIVSSGATAS